jgi:CheY-like chemotaxis protein
LALKGNHLLIQSGWILPMSVLEGVHANSSVLVVDDETNIRRFVVANLVARGFTAAEAASAEAGLDRLRQDPLPAALILDIRLPGMSGLDMLQVLAADERWANIPVIVMTASAVGSQFGEASFANVIQWLVKPISVQELLSAVQKAVRA